MDYFFSLLTLFLGLYFGYRIGYKSSRNVLVKKSSRKVKRIVSSRIEKSKEKIVDLLAKQGSIANDDVEELLNVSDSTAERYLAELEKDGRVSQIGKGRGVKYILEG